MSDIKRWDLVKRGDNWRAESGGRAVPGTSAERKIDAVRNTAEKAKSNPAPVTVKVHKENGRIQEERTYPSSADPRKSKG